MYESHSEFPLVLLMLFVTVTVDCIFHFVVGIWYIVGRWLEKLWPYSSNINIMLLYSSWIVGLVPGRLLTSSGLFLLEFCLGKGVFPPCSDLATNLRVGFFASLFSEESCSLQEDSLLTRNLKWGGENRGITLPLSQMDQTMQDQSEFAIWCFISVLIRSVSALCSVRMLKKFYSQSCSFMFYYCIVLGMSNHKAELPQLFGMRLSKSWSIGRWRLLSLCLQWQAWIQSLF